MGPRWPIRYLAGVLANETSAAPRLRAAMAGQLGTAVGLLHGMTRWAEGPEYRKGGGLPLALGKTVSLLLLRLGVLRVGGETWSGVAGRWQVWQWCMVSTWHFDTGIANLTSPYFSLA
jgi:hypothetical protein